MLKVKTLRNKPLNRETLFDCMLSVSFFKVSIPCSFLYNFAHVSHDIYRLGTNQWNKLKRHWIFGYKWVKNNWIKTVFSLTDLYCYSNKTNFKLNLWCKEFKVLQKNNSYAVIYLIELPHIKELGMYKDMETYLKNYLYKTSFLAYVEYRY